MLTVVLSVAVAAQTLAPIGQFGWRPPGAAQGLLMLPQQGNVLFEKSENSDALSCPTGQQPADEERVEGASLGAGSLYSIEMKTCAAASSNGTLFLRLTPADKDKPGAVNWTTVLTSEQVRLGIPDTPDQPAVVRLPQPGFAIVQFVGSSVDNGGPLTTFSQVLLDLRGNEPRALATGLWTMGGGRTACSNAETNNTGYSCSWNTSLGDFACIEKGAYAQRSFALATGRALPQDLGPAVPIDKATAGQLIRIPRLGLGRLVASLSSGLKLSISSRGYLVLEKSGDEWRVRDQPAGVSENEMEANQFGPIQVVEMPPSAEGRIFDVVLEGYEALIRYGPGVGVSAVDVAAPPPPPLDICTVRSPRYSAGKEILMARAGSNGIDVSYQDHSEFEAFEQNRLDVSETADAKAELRCPHRGVLSWDANQPIKETGSATPCERPMRALQARNRLGRLDLLWADSVTNLLDSPGEFSLRGQGRGTILLLDGALPAGVWEELAMALPNDVEVLRISVDASYSAARAAAALSDVSARAVAVVSVGLPEKALIETVRALPLRPLTTSVLLTQETERGSWKEQAFAVKKIKTLNAENLGSVLLRIVQNLGWRTPGSR